MTMFTCFKFYVQINLILLLYISDRIRSGTLLAVNFSCARSVRDMVFSFFLDDVIILGTVRNRLHF